MRHPRRTPTILLALALLGLVGCDPDEDAPQRVNDAAVDARAAGASDAGHGGPDHDPPRPDAAPEPDPEPDPRPDAEPPRPDAGGPGIERPPEHPLPAAPADGPPPTWRVLVLERFPHDPRAFTQGLAMVDGVLYESTGLNGQSSVRIVDLDSGAVQRRHDLAARYFGEGLAPVGDTLVQLTWRAGAAFVYDRASLAPQGEHAYAGEGWGLTFDGRRLILSDGTERLRFFDPATFAELGSVVVLDEGVPVLRLNELEYIDGEVLANVWMTDTILRIDPGTGRVIGRLDLRGLRPPEAAGADDVLNGIAWDAERQRLLVTGKRWPVILSIKALPGGL